ncbi:MAG: thymidine kinase [Rhodobacteraceae bacterium]|jgi:thymidine kinase|nr:thymidine kinase [Paracoccaceae bacterium]
MAKLYFHYSTMNAGKTTLLLQASHNYRERGMETYLLTAQMDTRVGQGRIGSRIGIGADADTFATHENIFAKIERRLVEGPCACVFIDEAQFLTPDQVWELARAVDDLGVPVMCYGLRVDFQGKLFPGSATLLALADEMREIRTICHCGKKATMVIRQDETGKALIDGDQIQIGGNETYVSLCRRHWRDAVGQ